MRVVPSGDLGADRSREAIGKPEPRDRCRLPTTCVIETGGPLVSSAHDRYIALQRQRNATRLALDPRTTALVIVDMQEYFLNPASPFSRACERLVAGVLGHFQERGRGVVEPSLRRLLDFFRTRGLRVVYTTVASELPDGGDLMPIFQQRNAANRAAVGDVAIPSRTDAWARIVETLEPRPGELVVNKTTYGTFNSTGLDHTLRSLGITSLIVGGVVTNVCVETTARDAADRGYDVVLLDDGCAAFSPEIHEATLLSFQGAFGRVRTADEVLALLTGGEASPHSYPSR
jgi:nicotinamidase-related amidase